MAFDYTQFYSDIRKTLIIQKRKYLRSILAPIFELEYQKLQTTPLGIIIKIPDPFIIQGIYNQDNDVFIYIYQTYYPIVERIILRRKGNVDDAKDAFQEGIIDIIINAQSNSLKIRKSIGDTIIGAGIDKWREIFKTDKYKNESPDEINENSRPLIEEDPFEKTDRFKTMSKCLNEISEKCRKLFEEFYTKKKDWVTIAKNLGYSSPESAKNQKYKCMENLKLKLAAKKYNLD